MQGLTSDSRVKERGSRSDCIHRGRHALIKSVFRITKSCKKREIYTSLVLLSNQLIAINCILHKSLCLHNILYYVNTNFCVRCD